MGTDKSSHSCKQDRPFLELCGIVLIYRTLLRGKFSIFVLILIDQQTETTDASDYGRYRKLRSYTILLGQAIPSLDSFSAVANITKARMMYNQCAVLAPSYTVMLEVHRYEPVPHN